MTNDDNIEINKRLDAILSVLLQHTKIQEETTREKITRLSNLGFDNQEIAKILNTTAGSVSKERSIMKKRTSK
jgi:DNA-binding NarL/FixJ family response regulator